MFLRPLAHWDGDARTRRPVRAATVAAPPGHGGQFAPWHGRDGPAGRLYHVAHGTNIIGGAPGAPDRCRQGRAGFVPDLVSHPEGTVLSQPLMWR